MQSDSICDEMAWLMYERGAGVWSDFKMALAIWVRGDEVLTLK